MELFELIEKWIVAYRNGKVSVRITLLFRSKQCNSKWHWQKSKSKILGSP